MGRQLDTHLINQILSYRGKHPIVSKCIPTFPTDMRWSGLQLNYIRNGKPLILKWLILLGSKEAKKYICYRAAENGHLEILKWARENGCTWDEQTCSKAAMNGQLEILQWARSNGCPWDTGTCAYAARSNHLHILKWARENGCPWNERTCALAGFLGHLEILLWARSNGCPDNTTWMI